MIKLNSDEPNQSLISPQAMQDSRTVVIARPAGGGSEDERPTHHLSALVSAVRRCWRIGLPLGVCLAAAAGFVAWKSFVPKYSASAYLRIDAANRPLIFTTADEGRGTDFGLYKSTQQQLLVTPFVLNTALRDTELAALPEIREQIDSIEWLKENLKVSFPANSEIMVVSSETVSPDSCVKIVNGVVNAYMQEVVMDERNERLNRLNSLERVYAEAEGKVRSKQSELKSLANALGTSDSQSLTVAQQTALTQFGMMQEKLGTIQFELMQAEGDFKIANEAAERIMAAFKAAEAAEMEADKEGVIEEDGPSAAELELAERTPDVLRMEEEVARREAQLESITKELGRSHPSANQLRTELAVSERMLKDRRRDAKVKAEFLFEEQRKQKQELASQRPMRSIDGRSIDLPGLAGRVEILKNQEKILQVKVDQLSDETRQLGRSSIDVELMRSEIANLEDVLRRVGEEIERTSIELKTSSRIKLLSPAGTASAPDAKKRLTRTAALSLFGLVAPFGLLVLFDLSRKRVNDVEGVTHALSLPTIGLIPMVSKDPLAMSEQNTGRRVDRKRLELAESVDGLASMILNDAKLQDRQVFMICSAMPGEGKSTVACQLSRSLARAGKKVAVVDFDLRRPSIHRYLGMALEPGIAEVLYNQATFEEAIQESDEENLSVLAAGEWTGHLHERCTSGAVEDLFDSLRVCFDIVIVDGSPVLPVHDARVIGKYTDGAILTLVRDVSRLPLAGQACEILKTYGVPLLGTVFIGASTGAYSARYHSYVADTKPQQLPTAK